MIRSLVDQFKVGIKKLYQELIRGLIPSGEKEVEIPEEWKDPEAVIEDDPIVPAVPIAEEPTVVFEEPIKQKFKIWTPPWFLKLKRILAFFIFIGCCVSAVDLITTFPSGLIFVIPTAIINLDYILKTHSKTASVCWYMLRDVEEDG